MIIVNALVLLVGFSPIAQAAVSFTVTPPAISNTYLGTITLQISNLTVGDTVVVQKYLDANTNGVVDAGDILVQQFKLTDGQAGMVIGGVTNINVPGDTDGATNGQITAKLNFPDSNPVQNIIGRNLFVLSSPAGHFSPITNSFVVTNFPFTQMISGSVVSNTTPVSNAIVLLFPPPGGNGLGTPVAGTVANNAGTYSILVPPGTYVPMAFKSNYIANYSTSPVLTLGSGQLINTNLMLTNTTASISGTVVDATNSSIGLPGLFLLARGTNTIGNKLLASAFTDTNGNFNMKVGSGSWGFSADAVGSLNVLGYVGYANNTNINAGTASVHLPFYKATALFYGSVTDNLGNPVPRFTVNAIDSANVYETDSDCTEASGYYVAVALGNLGGNDTWQLNIVASNSPTYYTYSQEASNVTLSTGQAFLYDFTASTPLLYISYSDNSASVYWQDVSGWSLQQNNNLAVPGGWAASGYSITTANGTNSITITPPTGNLFFRLMNP